MPRRHHVRCRRCETRRVLRRHPDQYYRLPKCRGCGAKSYRVDRWMMRRDTRMMVCTCGGYHFWHRQGSLFCYYRADGSTRMPGDADFNDRHFDQGIDDHEST